MSFARRVAQQPTAKLGFLLTGLVLLVALLGPFVVPAWTGYGPNSFAGKPFQPGVFGTDNLGRDVLSRFLEGGWRLLLYSALATVLGVGIGAVLGMLAAFRRGWLDAVIMRSGTCCWPSRSSCSRCWPSRCWDRRVGAGARHRHHPRAARGPRDPLRHRRRGGGGLRARLADVRGAAVEDPGPRLVPNIMGPLMVEVGCGSRTPSVRWPPCRSWDSACSHPPRTGA